MKRALRAEARASEKKEARARDRGPSKINDQQNNCLASDILSIWNEKSDSQESYMQKAFETSQISQRIITIVFLAFQKQKVVFVFHSVLY